MKKLEMAQAWLFAQAEALAKRERTVRASDHRARYMFLRCPICNKYLSSVPVFPQRPGYLYLDTERPTAVIRHLMRHKREHLANVFAGLL
jgi:hypothetical protein